MDKCKSLKKFLTACLKSPRPENVKLTQKYFYSNHPTLPEFFLPIFPSPLFCLYKVVGKATVGVLGTDLTLVSLLLELLELLQNMSLFKL